MGVSRGVLARFKIGVATSLASFVAPLVSRVLARFGMASEAVGPVETDESKTEPKDESLLDMETESDSDDLDDEPEQLSRDRRTDEVIRIGNGLKDQGTTLFKEQKWSAAIEKYREGFAAVPADISGYREAVARDLRVACLNNVAMCQSKIQAWDQVLITCAETQGIDPKNAKAWYRSGVAHHKLSQWTDAKQHLKKALELEPKNKKSGVNDYSRFDNLDYSDDDEDTKETEPAPPEAPPKQKSAPKNTTQKKTSPTKHKEQAAKPDSDSDENGEDEILSTK